ncbi:hypothetical protein ACJMK2_013060 [Sinanodonta woodiana]|uniref:G-protein coupled receptors family 1 profile domain-containing protein n=1 Tax=Sinanodonta woodiana TaxID=1069815 RepID=A0ABD3VA60_SINWO
MPSNCSTVQTTLTNCSTLQTADDTSSPVKTGVMATILCLIFLASIAGNTFVFLVFYKRPSLVTISNRFIMNLSICNMLDTFFIMPFVFVSLIAKTWLFGQIWCYCMGFLLNLLITASTLTLVVISIDRYCAVVTPLHYSMRITPRRSLAMIFVVWLIAVLLSVPPLVGWNHLEFQKDKSVCTVLWSSQNKTDRLYNILLVILCFLIPLIIIIWVYVRIFLAARRTSERARRNSIIPTNSLDEPVETPLKAGRRRSSSLPILTRRLSYVNRSTLLLWRRDEWKAAVTSSFVISTFILCWLLYFINIVLESVMSSPDAMEPVMQTVSILLAMSSCAVNPMVYVFRSKLQRQELRAILGIAVNLETLTASGRPFLNFTQSRDSPFIYRQGSEETDIPEAECIHKCVTTTTLTSLVKADRDASLMSQLPN